MPPPTTADDATAGSSGAETAAVTVEDVNEMKLDFSPLHSTIDVDVDVDERSGLAGRPLNAQGVPLTGTQLPVNRPDQELIRRRQR